MSTETRDRIAVRMDQETSQRLEQWYLADNCKSKNEFIVKAMNFYIDYLEIDDNKTLLPTAVTSAINGRLGVLEDHMLIADAFEFDRDDLKRRRTQSVQNVKATNSLISLEKRVHSRREQDWDDDEWQD